MKPFQHHLPPSTRPSRWVTISAFTMCREERFWVTASPQQSLPPRLARPVSSSVIGLDVRLSAQTESGHYLYLTYTGRVVINDDVAPKMASGEEIYGSEMYFTTNPVIKTNDPALAWMNDTIFVGKMQRNTMAGANGQGHLVYDIYNRDICQAGFISVALAHIIVFAPPSHMVCRPYLPPLRLSA